MCMQAYVYTLGWKEFSSVIPPSFLRACQAVGIVEHNPATINIMVQIPKGSDDLPTTDESSPSPCPTAPIPPRPHSAPIFSATKQRATAVVRSLGWSSNSPTFDGSGPVASQIPPRLYPCHEATSPSAQAQQLHCFPADDSTHKINWTRIIERTIIGLTLLLSIATLVFTFRADAAARTAQATADRSLELESFSVELEKEAGRYADRQLKLDEYVACRSNSSVCFQLPGGCYTNKHDDR